MARLWTSGFETGSYVAEPPPEGTTTPPSAAAGTPAMETSLVRTGGYSLRLTAGAAFRVGNAGAGTSGVPYYHRIYCYFTSFPGSAGSTRAITQRASGYGLRVTQGGVTGLYFNGTTVGPIGNTATLELNRWHCIEFMQNINTAAGSDDSAEWRVDGVTIGAETNVARGTAASTNWDIGDASVTNVYDMYIDDCALNDNTGSFQNGFPGEGKVDLLLPISDNARIDWTDGAGGTVNLFGSVDNVPPIGVATASSGATNQIEDATNGTTDTYDANCETPVSVGIRGQIRVAQAISRAAAATTTAQTTGVQAVSNPAIAEVTRSTGAVAAATEPTGWTTNKTAPSYNPSVVLATSPVVRVRKGTNVATIQAVSQMGLLVEYVQPAPPFVPPLWRRRHRNNR